MPVIPGLEESQRLSPSSPVPMIDAREERLAGAAMETLGEGMMRLSSAMERVGKEKQKLDVANATAEWRYAAASLAAEFKKNGPIDNDETGFKTQELFRKQLVKAREDISKSLPSEYHNAFMADINDEYTKQWMPAVTAEAAKGITAEAINTANKNVDTHAAIVRVSPGQLGKAIADVTKTISDNNLFSYEEKQKLIPEAVNKIFKSGVDNFTDYGLHKEAKDYLEANRSLLTDSKAYDSLTEHIDKQQAAYSNLELRAIRTKKERLDLLRIDKTDEVLANAHAMYMSAGTDMVKIHAADKYLDDMALRHPFLREQALNMRKGSTIYTEDRDNRFKAVVLAEAFKTGDYKKAIAFTRSKMDVAQGITSKSAYGLISQLESFDRGGSQHTRTAMKAGLDLLESPLTTPDIQNSIYKGIEPGRLVSTVKNSVAAYTDFYLKNPGLSAKAYMAEASRIHSRIYGTAATTPIDYKRYDSLEKAEKALDTAARELKLGKPNKQREKLLRADILNAALQIKEFQMTPKELGTDAPEGAGNAGPSR